MFLGDMFGELEV